MLQTEFEKRVGEVNLYFDFLEKTDLDYKILKTFDENNSYNLSEDLCKILKSNFLLILYNLVESTVLNSVISIFDEIKVDNLSYQEVSKNVRIYWSKQKYKFDEKIKEETLIRDKFFSIVEEIIDNVGLAIADRIEYGGSLDCKKIKKLSDEIGINFELNHYNENYHGTTFRVIKDIRNSLAHGKKSFIDIGKDLTINGVVNNAHISVLGLRHYKAFTVEHLENYISAVNQFVADKNYKLQTGA